MSRQRKKLDDQTLAAMFDKVADLYVFLATRPSDYALQETAIAALESRIGKNPIFRTERRFEKLADILSVDAGATPTTKRHIVRALANGASAPDVSARSVWFAVHGLRELSLEEPAFARAAAKAIKRIAVAHPADWQEAFESACNFWNGAEKNRLRDDLMLDTVRATLRPLGPA